jgi:hypothetical protein
LNLINLENTVAQQVNFEAPKVLSFEVSKKSIEIASVNRTLEFLLKVSHPLGISSDKTTLWFSHRTEPFNLSTELTVFKRTERDNSKVVEFQGALTLPSNTPSGLYDFYADPISGIALGQKVGIPSTTKIYPDNFNSFKSGEKSVLVRVDGKLNLSLKTFVGPSYSSTVNIADDKPRTLFSSPPLTKVGEIYDPKKYFEMRVTDLPLLIESFSKETCLTNNSVLKFIATGTCSFRVYTDKNLDYLENAISLSVEVSKARPKPVFSLDSIPTQNSNNLPKTVITNLVYTNFGDIVEPNSTTPTICQPLGRDSIRIYSGGICTLSYQTTATESYLASDILSVSFEITRTQQAINFNLPSSANIATKTITLSATTTSGGEITYETKSTGICSISGSTLNLLGNGNCEVTATQAGTSTLAPASATATVVLSGDALSNRKTITCVKGKSTKRVSGVNPKCPRGFKIKR